MALLLYLLQSFHHTVPTVAYPRPQRGRRTHQTSDSTAPSRTHGSCLPQSCPNHSAARSVHISELLQQVERSTPNAGVLCRGEFNSLLAMPRIALDRKRMRMYHLVWSL